MGEGQQCWEDADGWTRCNFQGEVIIFVVNSPLLVKSENRQWLLHKYEYTRKLLSPISPLYWLTNTKTWGFVANSTIFGYLAITVADEDLPLSPTSFSGGFSCIRIKHHSLIRSLVYLFIHSFGRKMEMVTVQSCHTAACSLGNAPWCKCSELQSFRSSSRKIM